ncbi:DNA polymerase III subunit psi [Atlantibacter subterraneus]|uniref:DNA polymerase III subunit psi n=1 Tax=Atlantibacter subterraneus TaxID=255519 RepID=A0A427V067_9ENTR|nr:DNA polymerase III subunit psi [Atlantibacter subterranea]QFH69851.1 DNA polymerase III subunit psi [Enterobacter sp. E76]MDA3131994.1 DNA polymerase III subunit psi [Atlantibacter subterranea]MDW2742681.1 DNA polymerase III subunit psi [Atlantibacter subterranea]RSB62335.1 DNA polymerase III subunit psi [Atlantibacter subterranea]RSE07076.1 DNA polymerase III subunit psi [Atlantibacter subterranea]
MTSRRDWQLQQLGITQWVLRRPTALQGEIAISLPAHIRLVMVAQTLPALTSPLIRDLLLALGISPDRVLALTPDRVEMLPPDSHCVSLWLGVEPLTSLAGTALRTQTLDELRADPAARAALWQHICEHEHDLFTHEQ